MRFFILFLLIVSAISHAKESDVLVIHSYHQGYDWSDDFQKGLNYVLSDEQIPHRILYMDTKRHQSPEYLEQVFQLYYVRFQKEKFKAILVNDNNALDMVNRLGPIIGDTPVIFSGINGYKVSMHANLNATGILSRAEVQGNDH